ncbi:phospholipid scramblase 2 [Xylocopa sonorina]|uniref:phospholipid scramblase 2 n=1 Tax=Xylocopa sonorina TaxID=1818115 RepID=UPI00403AEE02
MSASVLNRETCDLSQNTIQSIEMQQHPVSSLPPIFSRPTVITAQPQGTRAPIPVYTSDWVSSLNLQLDAFSDSYFLANVEQLEIQQVVDLSTLLGRSERRFQYRVKIPKAETVFLAMEMRSEAQESSWSCSNLIGNDLSLNVLDQCGKTAFLMRINSNWTYTLNRLHKITVGNSNLIGTVEENFGIVGSSFTVYDARRNELCSIYGPNVCGCCMYQEAQFQVISIDGTHQIASIIHQWDNTLYDYTVLITFPINTHMKLKSLLLAAAFLLEHMYFKKKKPPPRAFS